jgi:serine/threonine protein kinase
MTASTTLEARSGGHEAAPLPTAFEIVPGYSVVAHLSRNRNLDVYDVWSTERECRCVAKTLRPDLMTNSHASRRLMREGNLLMRFTHPHIVRAYEAVRRPRPVVILETLGGETLGHLIERRRRRLSLRELSYLGLHVASAVRYLHRRGILHLDLKPENIVCHEARATVIDLSIARRPGWSRRARGTRAFMAPEQFGHGRLSAATDVWGIGAVLYTAASGVLPFVAPPPGADERTAPTLASHRRLPTEFIELVDACLRPRAALRPELGEALTTLRATAGEEIELSKPLVSAG